jgi:FKBP-type peptidyl-prolyl cis-trans isomerase FkpA
MAYGSTDRKDAGGKVTIPANSELTFTIQLLEVRTPVTKPSGLVVTDLVTGTGKECPPSATVKVHYRGTLADGREFDSSYARQEPIEFQLAGLIKGWQEGIPGMKVGGKRKLVVPYHLAYGEAGSPPSIPGYATLTFEIELLDVK